MTVTPRPLASPARPVVVLRPARVEDADVLARWDREPHVIACASDEEGADVAFGAEWTDEIAAASPVSFHLIAELDGEPIGALQIIDPHREPDGYWGEIEPDLRAVDIWIGPADRLNRGIGTEMMRQAIDLCFVQSEVRAIVIDPLVSNTAAHRFYRRLGFRPEGERRFGEDRCLVFRLERSAWTARDTVKATAA